MTESVILKLKDTIMQRIVEESKDINTSYQYESGKTFIDNIIRADLPTKISENHFIYDNGFFQGKYGMRSQMLLLIEDILEEVAKAVIDSGKEA